MKAKPSLRQLRAANHSNVVILPTAAPRKVANHRYIDQLRAARLSTPWPGEYKPPQQRRREEEERVVAEACIRTPELLIVMVMMEIMDADQHQQLADKVEAYATRIGDDASSAAALITRRLLTARKRKGI